ncbi:glycerophosphodiester phosphodiesterase [Actinomadura alba]|uniref:Glycerophosphodiester phosphodiesterase n=1 Tax=Actinomadura alba TaxID=406431 RepID=A0ABR7M2J4_9ACTN|nr:glycerophosphodiester phosphodiesterase [Actinomadura alba]MBC6471240.1 glycerophosphodiester phosphodiesterase [Actinomadura alba]
MTAISVHRTDSAGADFFETAVASGAEYVEIDVRRTGDGEIVVRHDPHVNGTVLAEASYAEVCAAAGHRVPRVSEAMEGIAGRIRGHLDLKEEGIELDVAELGLRILGPGNFVVTSREPASIKLISRNHPEVRTALSIGRGLWERGALRDFSPLAALRGCGADWVAINHRLARLGVLRQCAREGIPAMVWTVNTERLMRRFLADPAVAVLITDRPDEAVRLRDGR